MRKTGKLGNREYRLNPAAVLQDFEPVFANSCSVKWDAATKSNAIKNLHRVSRPGLRQYASVEKMPRVMNGSGIAILSTSKGIMTDAKARKENVGGEVLCYIY